MSLERSDHPSSAPFKTNGWTEFAIEHGIQVDITPVIHRKPRLGPKVGTRPMLKRRTEMYMQGNVWSEFIDKQASTPRGYTYILKKETSTPADH